MTKKELMEKYQALLDERGQMEAYIRRLERERYHLRSLMMIEALDEWFSEDEYYEQADNDEQEPQLKEIQVRGFAPVNNESKTK